MTHRERRRPAHRRPLRLSACRRARLPHGGARQQLRELRVVQRGRRQGHLGRAGRGRRARGGGTGARHADPGGQPAHCKLAGTIEKEIRFELLLPDTWNGKFVMGGGGGFVGSVQNTAQTSMMHRGTALERGYATAGTDTGHQGGAPTRAGRSTTRARAQLRPPRRAPHRRGVEDDRQAVLRQGRRALVLHRLLARRRPGHDGVAALPR